MGGRELDPCTQKLHAQKNKARLVKKATHAAEHALEDQLELIRLHLASSTLINDVSLSPLTSVPGGRMWGHVLQKPLPNTVNVSTTYSPPCWELIHTLLSRLSKIESSVNILLQAINLELLCSDLPSFANSSSFPLQRLFLEYHIWLLTLRMSSLRRHWTLPWRHLSKVNWIWLMGSFVWPSRLGRKTEKSCS